MTNRVHLFIRYGPPERDLLRTRNSAILNTIKEFKATFTTAEIRKIPHIDPIRWWVLYLRQYKECQEKTALFLDMFTKGTVGNAISSPGISLNLKFNKIKRLKIKISSGCYCNINFSGH